MKILSVNMRGLGERAKKFPLKKTSGSRSSRCCYDTKDDVAL